MRELEVGVFRRLDFSGIGNMILGAMYAGVLVILIVSQLQSREGVPWGQFFLTGRDLSDLQCDLDMERKVLYTYAGGFI